MTQTIEQHTRVPETSAGVRLDQAAAELFPDFSRSRLQAWIKAGALRVNGAAARPRDKLLGGEALSLCAQLQQQGDWEAQDMALDVVYEDAELLVVNKPANLVVHPAAGNRSGTLLNALLHRVPALTELPRAGIVHRLDKDTTGLMVVAKSLPAHTSLVAQLQARSVSREYEAVVQGALTGGGNVEAPIGRHPKQRKKMAVVAGGKAAVTHYRVLERFAGHTHVRLRLETGRTHQIRVHMAHIGYPLVGDATYGGRLRLPKQASAVLTECLRDFPRQALHAAGLGLQHPASGELLHWRAPRPDDFERLLAVLHSG
ncbi:23S rRNA pseudouridine(1911/1915/1917) synthase RluD [Exilibacterium tricleocarpae]|uniref:Pseudouridine synthase n=1 Tax=Exilibacterium tricleocarpae TaxID=2591008 RepID=A0A545T1Y5_9GAMM|nr:23S rRNA pseudouridine(1911/1915/1917) synthase RluD [Exilibacterium tricleocarpae]TQV71205.1 23S rRNA pseudouridine(1911/1915/1917) synthase RluD [Exilibacterium tricleocarpae]